MSRLFIDEEGQVGRVVTRLVHIDSCRDDSFCGFQFNDLRSVMELTPIISHDSADLYVARIGHHRVELIDGDASPRVEHYLGHSWLLRDLRFFRRIVQVRTQFWADPLVEPEREVLDMGVVQQVRHPMGRHHLTTQLIEVHLRRYKRKLLQHQSGTDSQHRRSRPMNPTPRQLDQLPLNFLHLHLLNHLLTQRHVIHHSHYIRVAILQHLSPCTRFYSGADLSAGSREGFVGGQDES